MMRIKRQYDWTMIDFGMNEHCQPSIVLIYEDQAKNKSFR